MVEYVVSALFPGLANQGAWFQARKTKQLSPAETWVLVPSPSFRAILQLAAGSSPEIAGDAHAPLGSNPPPQVELPGAGSF